MKQISKSSIFGITILTLISILSSPKQIVGQTPFALTGTAVAGVSSISLNGGGAQTGGVALTNILVNPCSSVVSTTDYVSNASLTSAQTFTSSCSLGQSTSNTVDGTYKEIDLTLAIDEAGNNTPTWTLAARACPAANWSAGACSGGSSLVFQFAAITVQTGGGTITDNLMLQIGATGTAGTYNVGKVRGTLLAGSILSTGGQVQANCTACAAAGGWVLYFQMTFSASASGTVTCLASGNTGATNCMGIGILRAFGNS